MQEVRSFISGNWVEGERTKVLTDKFDGHPIAEVHEPSPTQLDDAMASLVRASATVAWPPYERFNVLARASELIKKNAAMFIDSVVSDTGFTIGDAERETSRAAETLLICAEEAKRIVGEMVPLDGAPTYTGRIAFTLRRPLGVICAITPFNSPLNTVCHKVGPALASGNALILKPAEATPLTANLLIETLLEAGVPPELMAVVHGSGSRVGQWLLEDRRPSFYAFTGSTSVGAHIRATIGLRRSQLELGSLSSTIVCEDAELDRAASLCIGAAFRKAGQVCTSIQRLYVHEGVVDDFVDSIVRELNAKPFGDPRGPGTFVGPVISEPEAIRIESWIEEATRGGAELAAGGTRTGTIVAPTILTNVGRDIRIMSEEVFGPVVLIRPFSDLDATFSEVNDTPYGLSAGIFTANIANALKAATTLRMGSVHINETSSSRVDLQPYGGVKESGLGHEGPLYAIREMTEERLISIGAPS